MKPLSERDENSLRQATHDGASSLVGMKPLSERDENTAIARTIAVRFLLGRNEATL